jgi:hypothetical protein
MSEVRLQGLSYRIMYNLPGLWLVGRTCTQCGGCGKASESGEADSRNVGEDVCDGCQGSGTGFEECGDCSGVGEIQVECEDCDGYGWE